MEDEKIKELEKKYPELFNKDNNEELYTLMQIILLKKGFKYIKDNIVDNEQIPENVKTIIKERSKEKIEEFKQLPPEKQEEKVEKIKEGISWGKNFLPQFRNRFQKEINIDPGRLIGLTDGIFGMVITLLAFGIGLPEILIVNETNFVNFIYSLLPTLGTVMVSFIFVSSFWIYHHEFLNIKTLNLPFIWLNILFLACITFIPFTTSIIGTYSEFFLAEVIFGINVFLTIITFLLVYRYAVKHNFLEEKPSIEDIKYTYSTFFIIIGLTIFVNLGDFLISHNFIYFILLIPIISTLRYGLKESKSK